MESGENGASGALALKLVNKENNQEHVNAIHRLRGMVERNARDGHRKVKCATAKSLAQVR